MIGVLKNEIRIIDLICLIFENKYFSIVTLTLMLDVLKNDVFIYCSILL